MPQPVAEVDIDLDALESLPSIHWLKLDLPTDEGAETPNTRCPRLAASTRPAGADGV